MPEIQPFAAWRYNPDVVGDLARVIVPPYDVIKEEERQRLAAEPLSAVQLTLEPKREDDSPLDNAYTRSRDRFRAWQADGTLVRDPAPALYVLQQDFEWDRKPYARRHLVAAVRLHEFEEKVILPHEQILKGPKDDRQRLIETSEANYEPVFVLTMGRSDRFRALLDDASAAEPLLDVTMASGERQRVWPVAAPEKVAAFQSALKDAQMVIADGHHRYNASLGVKRRLDDERGPGPWDYAMLTIAAMDDPDLLVLPTHRLVTGIEPMSITEMTDRLDQYFVVEELATPKALQEAMAEADGPAIGLLMAHSAFLLTPWDLEDAAAAMNTTKSSAWRRLDVSLLHGLVMDRVLGLGAGESPSISYTRYAEEAVKAVRDGSARMAFLLRPTPTDAVREIALLGETMPQKSTFFYPKLATGLLFRSWD